MRFPLATALILLVAVAGCGPKEVVRTVYVTVAPPPTPRAIRTPRSNYNYPTPFVRRRQAAYNRTNDLPRLSGLTETDIEYLLWFKEFVENCNEMGARQQNEMTAILADSISRYKGLRVAPRSQTGLDALQAIRGIAQAWSEVGPAFQQRQPTENCRRMAVAYFQYINFVSAVINHQAEQVRYVSSLGPRVFTIQGRRQVEALTAQLEQDKRNGTDAALNRQIAEARSAVNAEIRNVTRRAGSSLPSDLMGIKVR